MKIPKGETEKAHQKRTGHRTYATLGVPGYLCMEGCSHPVKEEGE